MRNPMFVYDEQLTTLVLDYCRWRLALDPVPLDFGGAQAASLDASLEGLINPTGTDAHRVMEIFDNELATAVVSCDSPRFLSFIPAAPDQGLAAVRHGGGLLLAPGHLVDGGGRGRGRREPGPRRPGRPGRPARRAPAGASCPAARPATSRP